ncbi:MAG TPA: hypothetical protein VJC11_00725 [Patescibacteria group bacterium]|nr:hypothetical protein [Patescibacteria group bacterium]
MNNGIDPARKELYHQLSSRLNTVFSIPPHKEGKGIIVLTRTPESEYFTSALKRFLKPDMGIQVHDHDQNRPIRITGPSIQDLNRHVGRFASPI